MLRTVLAAQSLLFIASLAGCAVDASAPAPAPAEDPSSDLFRLCPRWTAADTETITATSQSRGMARSATTSPTYGETNCQHAWVADFVIPDPVPGFAAGYVPTFTVQGESGTSPYAETYPDLIDIKTAADCATYTFSTSIYGMSGDDSTLLASSTASATWDASTGYCLPINGPVFLQTGGTNLYAWDHLRVGVASFATVNGAAVYYPVEAIVYVGG